MGRSRNAKDLQPYPALLERPISAILVIKPRAIGDVLLSTVVTPNLRAAFPSARIHFLTEAPAADILLGNPHIDEAIIFHPGKDSFVRLLWRLAREHYDLVFDLFCNPRTAQYTAATRAALRVGYPFRGRAWAYNVHAETRADKVHNTQFNLDPLRQLGIPVVSEQPVLQLDDQTRARMEEVAGTFRKRKGPLIALNPSGTWETKRWPLASYAALADRLIADRDANVLLLWGPGEKQDVETIARHMAHDADIAPQTSIRELGALIASCDFMISNDAGPMHIAAAVGIPTLGIFGPTNPHLQGPWNQHSGWVRLEDLDCLACNLTSCPIGNICMRDLPVESVIHAFEQLQAGRP
ncbi:MAG: glycosyltransferase family 9 protein [Bacteroidota bacterium]|nr:glycosyltransferase family 9 protein [Bacteroidota bacterium]